MGNLATQALMCSSFGGPDALHLGTVQVADPGIGEIRIRIHASGLNFPDLLMSRGQYQLKPELPFTLGFEAAGVVDGVGPGATRFRVGDRAMVRRWCGCHAEAITVPEDSALPLPRHFSFAEAAAFVVATSTAINAVMQRGQLRQGETLLVHGAAGGVGWPPSRSASCSAGA